MLKKTILMFILAASQAFAQQGTENKPAAEQRGSDKLDIKKLEQKYWAAKDDDFSVVQNRRYTKAERFYLTASAGIPFNDPYSTGSIVSGSLGYFFNERWGLEATYNSANLKDNDAVKQFVDSYGAIPDHNILKSSYFLSGIWVPFYAKMSVVDKAIIYFDMGLSVGAGNLDYEIAQKEGNLSKSSFAYKLGIFQQIFFSENFAIRADLINTWSTQDKMKYYAPGTNVGGTTVSGTRDLGSESINDTSLMIGLTYWH
ncbi:outer membrane beta-barrel domain-containing protein [Bdellovibrio sp. BCCA]|uniref:outer membrane beta-barrel domain-containing protein n=1 Tax=Bdellovibrio sp. BCCA TaxID=3136281 RepID=UPI0030F191CD